MTNDITVQVATTPEDIPDNASIQQWVNLALLEADKPANVCVRIVGIEEMTELNETYRHKSGPTNVLSFPADLPQCIIDEDIPLLGDIVVCAEVVAQEAQDKGLNAHWAHIIIHGTLHLQGHDHIYEQEAVQMETQEIALLHKLGYSNPYEECEYDRWRRR